MIVSNLNFLQNSGFLRSKRAAMRIRPGWQPKLQSIESNPILPGLSPKKGTLADPGHPDSCLTVLFLKTCIFPTFFSSPEYKHFPGTIRLICQFAPRILALPYENPTIYLSFSDPIPGPSLPWLAGPKRRENRAGHPGKKHPLCIGA